jgi:hypothetical protein
MIPLVEGVIGMDTERLQEIDQKIKRYEGIEELLGSGLQRTDKDAVEQEETDNAVSQDSRRNENEQN